CPTVAGTSAQVRDAHRSPPGCVPNEDRTTARMTFRAKPTVKRVHRAPRDADHRRTLLLNIGFGLVVLLALLILAGAGFASYYGEHFASLASVNGQGISKDEARERYLVDTFRLDYAEARIRSRQDAGRLDAASAESQLALLNQERQTLDTQAVENLIDASLQGQLASSLGVTVSDQQIADQLTRDATINETRHVWIIGVKPKATAGADAPTDEQKAAAKAQAEKALADVKGGAKWEDISTQNPDDVYSSKFGEVGWIGKVGSALDDSVVEPIFALAAGGVTDVIEGTDGEFRIARVTEIDPQSVDEAFQLKLKDAGVNADAYRRAARADALRKAVDAKLVADAVDQPSNQRQVSEIFLAVSAATSSGSGDEVKSRHILFSPNDDPNAAASVPAEDPAWKKAEDEANAEYQKLTKDPSTFVADATAMSDDKGTAVEGGQLPYYTRVDLDKSFGDAIFADGLTKDQILPPVKSAFGWHIIQFQDRRKQPVDRMKDIQALASQPGADFAALAKEYSEHPSKDKGGDFGWVARYQLDSIKELAIFKATVGGLTDVIQDTDGIYLFKIVTENSRRAEGEQAEIIKANAFSNWYTAQKNAARITREYQTTNSNTPTIQ
ncbi:MAG: peptidylprolyl isomerase, partial [Candidatus Limnocylindrales bacterium]